MNIGKAGIAAGALLVVMALISSESRGGESVRREDWLQLAGGRERIKRAEDAVWRESESYGPRKDDQYERAAGRLLMSGEHSLEVLIDMLCGPEYKLLGKAETQKRIKLLGAEEFQ